MIIVCRLLLLPASTTESPKMQSAGTTGSPPTNDNAMTAAMNAPSKHFHAIFLSQSFGWEVEREGTEFGGERKVQFKEVCGE